MAGGKGGGAPSEFTEVVASRAHDRPKRVRRRSSSGARAAAFGVDAPGKPGATGTSPRGRTLRTFIDRRRAPHLPRLAAEKRGRLPCFLSRRQLPSAAGADTFDVEFDSPMYFQRAS